MDGENIKIYEKVSLILEWEGSCELDMQIMIGGEWYGFGTKKPNINANNFQMKIKKKNVFDENE